MSKRYIMVNRKLIICSIDLFIQLILAITLVRYVHGLKQYAKNVLDSLEISNSMVDIVCGRQMTSGISIVD